MKGQEVEGQPQKAKYVFFPFFEAFSFLLNNGKWPCGRAKNNESPRTRQTAPNKVKPMTNNPVLKKLNEQFIEFQKTMEELYFLKRVAADLKSYRRMIRLRRYD
jgi:hypothetical protein